MGVVEEFDAVMERRAQRLVDEPCRGCGKEAGESKDVLWRACHCCTFGWVWLGIAPPLLPNGLTE
jgi:hypothetical protein